MPLRTLGLTEDAVDALDSATDSLRRILRDVAAECAKAKGQHAITPDCIERARRRVTQGLVSERSAERRAIKRFENRTKPPSGLYRGIAADTDTESESRSDDDVPRSRELAGVT